MGGDAGAWGAPSPGGRGPPRAFGGPARLLWGCLLALSACEGALIEGELAVPRSAAVTAADAGTEAHDAAVAPDGAATEHPDAAAADAGEAADAALPDAALPDAAPVDAGAAAVCGNQACEPGERCDTCPADCGACEWPPELAAGEDEVLRLMNELRAQGATCGTVTMRPVPPLAMEARLRDAARLHSLDMAEQDYFSHTSLDGRSFSRRIADSGYQGWPVGENIAAGNRTAEATFRQWVNSPGHCRNMMSPDATEIGIGHAFGAASRYGHYWTQKLGRR